jgi:hypothetical protein
VREVNIALLFASLLAVYDLLVSVPVPEEMGGDELGKDACFCRS